MFSNRKLQTAVRLGLGMGAGAMAVGFAPGALAQDAGADEPLEEIVTTGSRIKRADLDSASPVTVLDREDIMAQGITDIGSLIQRMPSMSGTPIGTTTNNGNNSTGTVEIDLRGMGPDRTVSLVNGKRTVDGGDYTTIPSIMIERVEILKDGASAVYGADAVTGVVNIITRTDFEGVNIDVQNSDWFDTKAGSQNSISILAGTTFDSGNFVFGAEYVDQEEAFHSDAPYSFLQGTYYILGPSFEGCESDPAAGCYFVGSSRIPESRLNFASQGLFMIENPGDVMTAHDGRTYNFSPVNYLQTPYKRLNYFGEGSFEVADNIEFTAQFRGNTRRSDQELAPLPYDSNIYPSYAGTWNGTPYLGVSEDNYYLRQGIDNYNAANPGANFIYEPLTNVRRRMVERPRHYTQDLTQFQAVMGFNGSFGDKDWDVYYNRGKRSIVNNNTGQFSGVRLTGALGPSADLDGNGTPECYTDITDPSTIITGCTPMNFFAGEGAVTDEMYDWVAVETVDTRVSEQEILGASITGSAFELPGGDMGWAAGYGYRADRYKFTPDSAKSIGAVTGGTGEGTNGSLYSNSLFVELYAPIFDNGSQALTLTGGARYDDYNVFGDDTTWQFGVELQAMDSLKLRATAGTAFRAPDISELYAGLGRSAPSYTDPCDQSDYVAYGGNGTNVAPGCGAIANRTDNQTTSFVGGNLELTPETADTYTAGIVFTPEIGSTGLSVTLDYWKIDLVNAISSYGVQYILDQCYTNGDMDRCGLITRRGDADYTIAQIIDSNVNVATQTGEGVDTQVRVDFDTGFGEFEVSMLWAHLLDRSKTSLPGDPEQDLLGKHTNRTAEDGGTYAEDKMNFSVRFHTGDLTVSYLAEFISEVDVTATYHDYTYKADSRLYHDLVFDYTLDAMGETRLTAGFTNLTDEEPPFFDPGFNAQSDPATYRMFGPGYFLRISQTF